MLVRLPQLDVTRLAADYSAAVRAAHSDLELKAIRDRNESETDTEIDHVHDYIDANDLLADAVALQLGHVDDWSGLAADMLIAQQRAKAAAFQLSRVLIACEYSRTVASAFEARGHSVISCDVLPAEAPGNHYQGDVRDIINDGYHLMIAHPPCTYLCNSGVKHLVRGGQRIDPQRWEDMREGAEFFRDLGQAPIDRIARENPIMHKYAVEIIGRRADQYVQPHEFGHDHSKKTGLHLDGLPPLVKDPAQFVPGRDAIYKGKPVKRWANQSPCGADSMGPSADRGHKRSGFFTGLADAMANQWGGITRTLTAPAEALPIGQMELFS